jgi:hypothetical protein
MNEGSIRERRDATAANDRKTRRLDVTRKREAPYSLLSSTIDTTLWLLLPCTAVNDLPSRIVPLSNRSYMLSVSQWMAPNRPRLLVSTLKLIRAAGWVEKKKRGG